MKASRIAGIALAVFLFICVALLASDKRVLIWETKVNPGDSYIVEEHGDLGKSQQSTLVCRYFTGRSIKTSVLWYSSNNIMGRDQCPFVKGAD